VFDGRRKASDEERTIPPALANVTALYPLQVVLPNPHLWNGRPDPYLYQAVVELRSADGVVDSSRNRWDCDFIRWTRTRIFPERPALSFARREPASDRFNQGWAITEADMDEDIQLIKEMGCTVVRCAHYQHSDYFYSLLRPGGHSRLGGTTAGE